MGTTNDTHPAVAAYHRLLVWDIETGPDGDPAHAERVLNPLVGKSLVVYLVKPAARRRPPATPAPVGASAREGAPRGPRGDDVPPRSWPPPSRSSPCSGPTG